MYRNIKTSVKIVGERSKEFEVKVDIHQSLILSPLLFAVVMNEVTKDVRKSGVKNLLYADDLVLLGDSWKEAEKTYMHDGKKL